MYCILTEMYSLKFTMLPIVFPDSYNGNNKINTIYRQSSNNSDVSLICKTKKEYNRWKWTWEQRPNSQTDLMAVEEGRDVQVKGPIKPGRLSSTTYNSQVFIFHISPVNFNYSGTYRCITDEKKNPYTTTMLRTIRGLQISNQSIQINTMIFFSNILLISSFVQCI